MKVIELTNEFSLGNGRAVAISEIASALAKYFDCEVWYSYFVRDLQKVRNHKVKIRKMPKLKIFFELLKIKEPTVVHTHFGKSFLMASLARRLNKNIIHIHTEHVNPPYQLIESSKLKYYLVDLLHWFSYRIGYVDYAVGISKYACSEIKRFGFSKNIRIIYCGVDFGWYNDINIKKLNGLKEKLKLKKNDFVVCCFSRFSPSKNMKILIENFEKIKPCKLILVGAIDYSRRDYFESCLKLAKEKGITIITNVPEEEKKYYYHLCDVFVYPSLWEGFGLPIIEAMACGKPVICFKRFAMKELVKNNYNGFCVNNEDEFFEKIKLLYKNSKLRKRLSENAKEFASNFDWKKIGEQYKKLIDNIKTKK